MKKLESSDIFPMVLNTMNHTSSDAAVRLAMPVSTSAIRGLEFRPGANSAIWGTSAYSGASGTQNFSAIWGTCPFRTPLHSTWLRPALLIERLR
jgi:hypothetical protein